MLMNGTKTGLSILVLALSLAPIARAQCDPVTLGTFETEFEAERTAVSGLVAYVTDAWMDEDEKNRWGECFLRIYDVSDAGKPVLLGSVEVDWKARAVAVEGDRAYVGGRAFQVIDVSDPTAPAILGSVATAAHDIVVRGPVAFVAGSAGLQAIDVSDDANPFVLDGVALPAAPRDFVLSGSVAYLTFDSGFATVDVSNPAAPELLATRLIEENDLRATGIDVSSSAIYVVSWNFDGAGAMHVYSAFDPANPVFLDSMPLGSEPEHVKASGTTLYVTEYEWLHLFDVSIPTAPSLVGTLDVGGGVGARLFLDDGRLYTNSNWGLVSIIDVATCEPLGFGGCCVGDDCYEWMTESNCAAIGGVYLGNDSLCGDSPCSNDDCARAFSIDEGDTAFSTIDATTDGPPLPEECDKGSGVAFENDVWFEYVPVASGVLTVSTCDQADFDTRLAAYTGVCGALELVACNDDAPGCAAKTSIMEVTVSAGTPVRIRVGGSGATRGTGTLTLSQSSCAADIDGNGEVDFEDLVRLLGDWGPCGG